MMRQHKESRIIVWPTLLPQDLTDCTKTVREKDANSVYSLAG